MTAPRPPGGEAGRLYGNCEIDGNAGQVHMMPGQIKRYSGRKMSEKTAIPKAKESFPPVPTETFAFFPVVAEVLSPADFLSELPHIRHNIAAIAPAPAVLGEPDFGGVQVTYRRPVLRRSLRGRAGAHG